MTARPGRAAAQLATLLPMLLPVLASAACLTAAMPPAWFAGAPWLVLPGLMLQFAVATGPRRPLFGSWLCGALHIGAFSWSLRHVLFLGWLSVALVGGLYFVAAAVAVRALRQRLGAALAFGLAVAGSCWLRAEAPEIPYPHGQPCHVFWQSPWLLGAVRLGGEPLANALLAALAAALVDACRSWRVGVPAWRRALGGLGAAGLVAVAITWLLAPAPRSVLSEAAPTVAIAALEPGVHPTEPFVGLVAAQRIARWRELFTERWLRPTRGVDAALVLWPESSVPDVVDPAVGRRFLAIEELGLPAGTRLCFGGSVQARGAARETPAAILVDARGQYLDHHEKRRLVPCGEYVPFVAWLPAFVAEPIRAGIRSVMGDFEVTAGTRRPPLHTHAGVPFAALVCYDNAFPATVADEVAAGARFLCVLSNEAWYRGGAELEQLAAITVLRAVATATPFVRCTTDGRSLAVSAAGGLLAWLPAAPTPSPAPRILRVDLPLGSGLLPPMAPWHPRLGWTAAAVVLLACLHGLGRRARLLRIGQAPAGGAGVGPQPDPPAGS